MDKTDYYIWWHVFFGQLLTYNVQSDKGHTCKKTVGLNLNVVIAPPPLICPRAIFFRGHIFWEWEHTWGILPVTVAVNFKFWNFWFFYVERCSNRFIRRGQKFSRSKLQCLWCRGINIFLFFNWSVLFTQTYYMQLLVKVYSFHLYD